MLYECLDEHPKSGLIRPIQSQWASLIVVVVSKKDGTLRFCVYYRLLKATTILDIYPLQRIDDCIDCVVEAKVLTALEVLWRFGQVQIKNVNKYKTTIFSHLGTFRYDYMPIGLQNAVFTLQREWNIILFEV